MSSPPSKRRRPNDASAALSRPFRSPFKSSLKQPERKAALDNPSKQPEVSSEQHREGFATHISPNLVSSRPLSHFQYGAPSHYKHRNSTLHADPAIASLLKSQRLLEVQLREAKEALDVARQAARIEREALRENNAVDSSNKASVAIGEARDQKTDIRFNCDLKTLTTKWREVSRAAAEDLFSGVRDRVNRMGGPKAFKEMQERQHEFLRRFNELPIQKGVREDYEPNNEQPDMSSAELVEDPEIIGERGSDIGDNETGELDGEEFTMSMMLKLLHINFKIIGYDRQEQRWTG